MIDDTPTTPEPPAPDAAVGGDDALDLGATVEQGKKPITFPVAEAMAEELHSRLAVTKHVGHPGEGGRARENLVCEYLQRLIPSGFTIGSGFVIDSAGQVSKQQDIVISREAYHPQFSVGGVSYYVVEAVAAVIEVKARIESSATLRQALDSGASVKALDRTGGGINYVVTGGDRGVDVDPERHTHQVFSAIITVDSMSAESCATVVREWMEAHPRRAWPNGFVSLTRFALAYAPSEPRSDPMAASEIGFAAPPDEQPRNTHPILDLSQQLLSFLRVAPIIDFRPSAYLPGSYKIFGGFPAPG